MAGRTDLMLRSIDVATSKGLELGPLVNPVVRREMGDIRYIDHVDTDALRARYATHVGFDIDAIVPIDYVSHTGSIRDAVGGDVPFDYAIASHVIEHVPDLIGWLGDVRSVLRDDGVLSLAIPDHRRCFDALRSPTVTAEVIHAHLTKATVPSPRQVFDHYSCAVAWHGLISWPEEPPFTELTPVHTEAEAFERAAAVVATAEYVDVHCWVFTPTSFTRLFSALQRLQLVPFSLDACSEVVEGEFFATLRAVDAAAAVVVPSLVDDGLPTSASEHAVLRSKFRATHPDCEAIQDELRRTLASRSWKVTRPLRALNRLRARPR
ncbi:MAG: class I SAM-dependent methyltransferase [Actinomycetota bacterium]|nr:class I SAM-dependent methyltransferase [Actinomycetota bacterium]